MAGARIPSVLLLLRAMLTRERRARNTLVCIRRLLSADLLVRRLAAAAAHAEQPEEAGRQAECNSEPDDREHLLAHARLDIDVLEGRLEHAGQHAVHNRRSDGRREDEERLCGRHNSCNERAPAREDGEEAEDELRCCEDERNGICPDHPARDLLVCVEALLQLLRADDVLGGGVLEAPDREGVEPEV